MSNPRIRRFDIEWEYKEDPDRATSDDVDLGLSKIGGTCYFSNTVREGEELVLQLDQRPAKLNFGGYTAVVVRTKDGALETRLG